MTRPYYQDGLVTLYHADFRDVLPGLEDGSAGLVLTDPPYGHNNNDGDLAHRWEAALGIRPVTEADARPIAGDGPEASGLLADALTHAARLLAPGGCVCVCGPGGGGQSPAFARWSLMIDATPGLDFKQMVVWDKRTLGLGWHYRRSYEVVLVGEKPGAACRWYGGNSVPNIIRDITGLTPSADGHPTPKPEALMGRFIAWHSQEGDLVVDPFAGAGTTLAVAKRNGRRAVGCEIDERWCDLAARRLSQGVLEL